MNSMITALLVACSTGPTQCKSAQTFLKKVETCSDKKWKKECKVKYTKDGSPILCIESKYDDFLSSCAVEISQIDGVIK